MNEVKSTVMLIPQNTITSLIIIYSNDNQVFYKKFDTVHEIINLGTVIDEELVTIIGTVEIAITISK